MAEHSSAGSSGWLGWVWPILAGLLATLSVLWFLQTRRPLALLVGFTAAALLLVLPWVHRDARWQGLPAWPWVLAIVLAPPIGLVAYLAVRELRASGT